MSLSKKSIFILVVIILLSVAGCYRKSAPVYYMREDVDFSFIKKVAVMPLQNLTDERYADEIVRQTVISELLASGLVDVTIPGEVTAALEKLNIKSAASLNPDQIKQIGKLLNVQALILGSVQQYGEVKFGSVTAPEVTITLMMADVNTGTILWSVTRTLGGSSFMSRHFGAKSKTMSETVVAVVREALQTFTE
ncbi:MAG: hypothetical protein GXP46_03590 [Deferribacteres bacterium]|nr:hypothetical protein [Deferribacteres bacterium]